MEYGFLFPQKKRLHVIVVFYDHSGFYPVKTGLDHFDKSVDDVPVLKDFENPQEFHLCIFVAAHEDFDGDFQSHLENVGHFFCLTADFANELH